MKKYFQFLLLPFACFSLDSAAQTNFVYDQQSATESGIMDGSGPIQQSQPVGQSFTPSLSGIGFVRLRIYNGYTGDFSAATIYISLRSDSITGAVLSSTAPVSIPGGAFFAQFVDFFFTNTVTITPGAT